MAVKIKVVRASLLKHPVRNIILLVVGGTLLLGLVVGESIFFLGPLVGLGGEGVFLGGEVAELLAVLVELGQGVESSADLVEPVAEGAQAGVGSN